MPRPGLRRRRGFRPCARNRTTRQRRFIRPASLAGLSFLLDRRGGIARCAARRLVTCLTYAAAPGLAPRRQAPSDSLDQLSPAPWRGFLCNQRCGWALGWWACVREGSAGPVWQDTKMDPPSPAPLWRGFCLCAPRWNADHRNQCASTSFLAGLARRGLATTTSTFSGPSDRQAYTPPSVGCPAVTQRGVPPATE